MKKSSGGLSIVGSSTVMAGIVARGVFKMISLSAARAASSKGNEDKSSNVSAGLSNEDGA